MKRVTAFLLSASSALWFGGTSLALKFEAPKEPPSTTLVVQTSTPLSGTTHSVTTQSVRPPQILTVKFAFGERSDQVTLLQKALGGLEVDGYYGLLTRAAHLKALQDVGLPTNVVPKAVYKKATYNISSDPKQRCPRFEAKFREYGLKPVEVFSYIAWRESKCSIGAINARFDSKGNMTWTLNKNGTFDSGLLQINSSWRTVTAQVCGSKLGDLSVLRTLDCNLKMAKYLLEETSGGLRNWRIYKH